MSEVYKESVAPKRPSGKKLSRISIEKGKGGGHIVTHEYDSAGMSYHRPEPVPFGKEQGKEMLAHVGKVMGVKEEAAPEVASSEPGEAEEQSGDQSA